MNGCHLAVGSCLASLVIYLKRGVERQCIEQLTKQSATAAVGNVRIGLPTREGREARMDDDVGVVYDCIEETSS